MGLCPPFVALPVVGLRVLVLPVGRGGRGGGGRIPAALKGLKEVQVR